MAVPADALSVGPGTIPVRSGGQGYLFGPFRDLFCLGGGSLLVIGLVALLRPAASQPPHALFVLVFAAATLLNYPHFMHSYQIFYADFGQKLGRANPLRTRFIIAGIVAPVVLLGMIGTGILSGIPAIMALIGSLFVLLTGWHYVKQGYGILMLDATLKRRFFDGWEKRLLVGNCYAVWACYWCLYNSGAGSGEALTQSILLVPVPRFVTVASIAIAALSLVATVAMIASRVRHGRRVPAVGLLVYATTLYVWLFLLLDPWFLLIIPAFHSLQYLIVVWRYGLGRPAASDRAGRSALAASVAGAMLTGVLAFFLVPALLDAYAGYDHTALGGGTFIFAFSAFINIHHYFLDNVMWRRENADVRRRLFATA